MYIVHVCMCMYAWSGVAVLTIRIKGKKIKLLSEY